jgi:hypothetical protein
MMYPNSLPQTGRRVAYSGKRSFRTTVTLRHSRTGRTATLPPEVTAATEFRVIDLVAQHDPEPDAQLTSGGDPGFAQSFLDQLAAVEAPEFGIAAHGMDRRFSPKKAHQRVALLAELPQSLAPSARMFAGDHSDVTGYGLTVGEASRITEKDFGGESGDGSDARMSHQPARLWPLLRLFFDLAVEIADRTLKLRIQREQGVTLLGGMRSQRQGPKRVLASWGPEGVPPAQPVAERQRLQSLLYARADAHELMAVPQEDLQIALLAGRHPNRRKTIFRQQRKDQVSVAAVVFLFAGFGSPDLRGMTYTVVDLELFEQSQEPVHRSGGFDAHQGRPGQSGIELAHLVAFVLQFFLHELSRAIIQHGNRLLSRVQINAYNFHLGLLRSEQCQVRAPTVYSARCEAGFVMPSGVDWV